MIEIPKADKKYKVIWIGDSGVGKTSILTKALKNHFDKDIQSTLGFEFYNIDINIGNKIILLQTWDTCGQESFQCIVNMFYKRSKIAILVYSVDNRESFERINFWLNEVKTNANENIKLILIGNKTDLTEKRQVSYEEGKKYSEENRFSLFLESSAKEGDIPKLILKKIAEILYKSEIKSKSNYKIQINNQKKKNFILQDYNYDNEFDTQCCL